MLPTLPRTPSLRLDGRRALGTGAGRGLGRACSAALCEAGDRAHALVLDVTDSAAASSANRSIDCSTKHALEGTSKALALGPHGIRVNTVCPTIIDTPMTHHWLAAPAFRDQMPGKIALGRVDRMEDVMGAVLFLAVDAAALVTGSALMVDGGRTAA